MSEATSIALPEDQSGHLLPVPAVLGSFTVAYDASVAAAAALSALTHMPYAVVRIVTTTDAFVTSAVAPTATAAHHFCPAGVPQDLRFPAGHKLAFIKLTAAGSAYCSVLG